MYTIATLTALRHYLGLETGADDERLLAALNAASASIERIAGRRFTPSVAARPQTVNPALRAELPLNDDLLALESLVCSDGKVIPIESALLLPAWDGPASVIVLLDGRAFTWAETPVSAVTVTGVWGWHDSPGAMWRESGDALAEAISADSFVISVTDANGPDAYGESPRFQVGHILKIGAEFMRVLAIMTDDEGDDLLTVRRGINGTTAAAHDAQTPVETFQPAADVIQLCIRWAAWLYREPDSRTPGTIPAGLLRAVERLRRIGVRA